MKIYWFMIVLLMMALLSSPISAQDAPNEKAKVITDNGKAENHIE